VLRITGILQGYKPSAPLVFTMHTIGAEAPHNMC